MSLERKTWCMLIEFTFPVLEDDLTEKYLGDAEVDFSRRAFERTRPQLDAMVENGPMNHFYVKTLPHRVIA